MPGLLPRPGTRHAASRRLRRVVGCLLAFFALFALFLALAFLGLAYSLFPYVVIDRLTIWEAAAHPSALEAVFAGAIVVLPFIVGYTIMSYRIFRGKAGEKLYD